MVRRSFDSTRLLLLLIVVLVVIVIYRQESVSCPSPQVLGATPPAPPVLDQTIGKQPIIAQDGGSASMQKPIASGAKIAMISMTTFDTSYDYIAISNKHKYAKKHGYDMIWDFEPNPGQSKVWDKLTNIENAIKAHQSGDNTYEWLWWLDYDILITNTTIKIEDIIADALHDHPSPDKVDVIVTPDCFPLNAGSMIFRVTPWILDLYKEVRKCGDGTDGNGWQPSEQDCLRDMIRDNTLGMKDKSVSVLQSKLNAFPIEIPCYDDRENRHWERGMFVVHFAGAWAHLRAEGGGDHPDPVGFLMRKYVEDVV